MKRADVSLRGVYRLVRGEVWKAAYWPRARGPRNLQESRQLSEQNAAQNISRWSCLYIMAQGS